MKIPNPYRFREHFTRIPGGRFKLHGEYSGEEFFERVLLPAREQAGRLTIDLSGTRGFARSFLDQSFGEYAARFGEADFDVHFELAVTGDSTLLPRIRDIMHRASKDSAGA